jgi:hypothetical protein
MISYVITLRFLNVYVMPVCGKFEQFVAVSAVSGLTMLGQNVVNIPCQMEDT